jgi:hypothetical protein
MELALHRRKQFSHPKLRIRWLQLCLDLIQGSARANRIHQELERRKYISLRRNMTDSAQNLYIA